MLRRAAICFLAGAVSLIATSAWADTVVQAGSAGALGANDSVNFAQFGGDGTAISPGTAWTSAHGHTGFVDFFSGGGSFSGNGTVADQCPASPSCSWTGGFTPGESLVWSFDGTTSGGSAPVGFRVGAMNGVGALVQSDAPGAFTASLDWFTTSLILGGSFTAASDAAGDPIFIGALDLSGAGIGAVKFNLTDGSNDLAVGTLELNGPAVTPEPASIILFTNGLLGLGFTLRKGFRRS